MKTTTYLRCVIATGVAFLALLPKASAEDTLKVASAQRGAWETSAPASLASKPAPSRSRGSSSIRPTPRQASSAYRAAPTWAGHRHHGRATPLRQGRAGANHRCERTGTTNYWDVLKTSSNQADRQGSRRQDDRVTLPTARQPLQRARLHQTIRAQGQAGVRTGAAAGDFKELEANHIDVGWAAPPFGLDEIEQDKIRVVARANDVSRIRAMTGSVLITECGYPGETQRRSVRFTRGHREKRSSGHVSDPAALKHHARNWPAYRTDRPFSCATSSLRRTCCRGTRSSVSRLIMKDARAQLSRRQVAELIRILAQQDSPTQGGGLFRDFSPKSRRSRRSRPVQAAWRPLRRSSSCLLRPDAGRPDHLGPLLGLADDELLEVGWRAREHQTSQLGEPLPSPWRRPGRHRSPC